MFDQHYGCVNAEASQTDENKENNVKKACVHRIDCRT